MEPVEKIILSGMLPDCFLVHWLALCCPADHDKRIVGFVHRESDWGLATAPSLLAQW
jgi:hypothetical protein